MADARALQVAKQINATEDVITLRSSMVVVATATAVVVAATAKPTAAAVAATAGPTATNAAGQNADVAMPLAEVVA
jgi:hypothetical protein